MRWIDQDNAHAASMAGLIDHVGQVSHVIDGDEFAGFFWTQLLNGMVDVEHARSNHAQIGVAVSRQHVAARALMTRRVRVSWVFA